MTNGLRLGIRTIRTKPVALVTIWLASYIESPTPFVMGHTVANMCKEPSIDSSLACVPTQDLAPSGLFLIGCLA
jgi:hypothetical protein